jgi:hypothetical protein
VATAAGAARKKQVRKKQSKPKRVSTRRKTRSAVEVDPSKQLSFDLFEVEPPTTSQLPTKNKIQKKQKQKKKKQKESQKEIKSQLERQTSMKMPGRKKTQLQQPTKTPRRQKVVRASGMRLKRKSTDVFSAVLSSEDEGGDVFDFFATQASMKVPPSSPLIGKRVAATPARKHKRSRLNPQHRNKSKMKKPVTSEGSPVQVQRRFPKPRVKPKHKQPKLAATKFRRVARQPSKKKRAPALAVESSDPFAFI